MNHDYKYEQMYQEGRLSEEDRNALIPAIRPRNSQPKPKQQKEKKWNYSKRSRQKH